MTTLERAIETYGDDMQLNVAIEEFSELIKEICKFNRGNENIDNIIEEMADCYIMLEQLKIIFEIEYSSICAVMAQKLERLKNRLDEREMKKEKSCLNCRYGRDGNTVLCHSCIQSYDKVTGKTTPPSMWQPEVEGK